MRSAKSTVILCLLFIGVFFSGVSMAGNDVLRNGDIQYLSGTIVVKFKALPQMGSGNMPALSPALESYLTSSGISDIAPLLKASTKNRNGMERIFVVKYSTGIDPLYLSQKISGFVEVEWAEPKFVYAIDYTPNDPNLGLQYGLTKINAPAAWDISKGDTSVVIGIIDTGVDWDHPDLAANIWKNWAENPTNGVDDDNNGYIDDYTGWDFGGLTGTPDNNPMEDRPDHGTHVAGISSGVTDNGIGIASIGFNCKIMAVKTSRDDVRNSTGQALISFGYEGIIYASDNGADVVNCSWGGGGYSLFGQDAITYATNNGTLVVCAAGNDNSTGLFFPAYYKNVISVASSDGSDAKSGFSNYGTNIDVIAPGSNIYSTWQNNVYTYSSGTSMASPLAAGLAGLIKARFPTLTPLQVGERMRVTTDDIYTINPGYNYMLGKGRLNALNALSVLDAKSVRAVNVVYSDEAPGGNGDGILQPGETITVAVEFTNYLAPLGNIAITFESTTTNATVLNGTYNTSGIGTLQNFNNNSSKFSFSIASTVPNNAKLQFLMKYSDGSYSDFEWSSVVANPNWATQSGNNVALTITSKGTLAYNDFPDNFAGDGFKYLSSNSLMFEGALVTGISATKISDAARNTTTQNQDFQVIQPFLLTEGIVDYTEGTAVFNDNNAGSSKLGITVSLKSYTYPNAAYSNFIILHYRIHNTSASILNNFFAGLFVDWDLIEGSGANDRTMWDSVANLGYVYNQTGSPAFYTGTALISDGTHNFWAIKNDGGDGGFQIYDGYSDAEKWQSLSSAIGKPTAGPGDISNMTSGGPYSINAGDSIDVAFAIIGGDSLASVQQSVVNARTLFAQILTGVNDGSTELPNSFSLSQNYPNPFNPSTTIEFSIPSREVVSIKVYDILGKEVAVLFNSNLEGGKYSFQFDGKKLTSGVYIYRINAGSFTSARKMLLLK